MPQIKFTTRIAILCLVAVTMSISLPLFVTSNVMGAEELRLIEKVKYFFLGKRPSKVATGRQRGGARRDRCPNVSDPLLAIVPFNQKDELFIEKTISKHPLFWSYVPYLPTDRRQAEFVIIDENEEDVYSGTFLLSQKPGIVSLQLPANAPNLKDGKKYQWVFSIICNPLNRSGDATVNGWLEKVPASDSLNAKLQTADPQNLFSLYAEEGLWYEAVTALANFGKTNPQNADFQSGWSALLGQLGLNELGSPEFITYVLPDASQNSETESISSQPLPSLIPVDLILESLEKETFMERDGEVTK